MQSIHNNMYTLENYRMNDQEMYMPSIFYSDDLASSAISPEQSYSQRIPQNDVKIAQQEESWFDYSNGEMHGGFWSGECERIQQSKPFDLRYRTQDADIPASFPRPLLNLSTCFDQSTYLQDQTYMPTSACSSYPSSDMGAFSNESSPLMNSQYSTAPQSPITPVTTPLLSGQMYTAPGLEGAFVLVPVFAQDAMGNYTTVFVPKPAPMSAYMDDTIQSQIGYCADMDYTIPLSFGQDHQPQFGYTENVQAETEQDDGTELIGMGLYDEPPELLYSASTTPELTAMCTPEFTGRGLVLEQSFGLPETDDEDEEYEDEEDDQESEGEDEDDMTY